MKTLIRIVFVIFIANGIDCLGEVCDNCCDCLKIKEYEEIEGDENEKIKKEEEKQKDEEEKKEEEKEEYEEIEEDEEIKEDGNNTAESLVNKDWFKAKEKNKENNLVLKIFKKKDDNAFQSKENGDKISIELDEKGNSKIADQNKAEDHLKLKDKKYALFEIKTQKEETVYLYCSDVESIGNKIDSKGIFGGTDHISISVKACDTEKVTNMESMFSGCSSLKELDLNNFNTTKVAKMKYMFYYCSSLKNLNIRNFNTTNVTNMFYMFFECSSLTELDLKSFNTKNVTNMGSMFSGCSSLKELDLKNFDTTNVTDMGEMFKNCSSLIELE